LLRHTPIILSEGSGQYLQFCEERTHIGPLD
jgi:hypothetical protein